MKEKEPCIALLEKHDIKPTANRILILKTLLSSSSCPKSVMELEEEIMTIDKSNIFRTLMLFVEKHLVHSIEEGRDGAKYEICFSTKEDIDEDQHPHFLCEKCHRTFCMKDESLPKITNTKGFSVHSANYVLKGLCPTCKNKVE